MISLVLTSINDPSEMVYDLGVASAMLLKILNIVQ